MRLARNLFPDGRIDCREEGIAGKVSRNFGHDQPGGQRQGFNINLCTANYKQLAIAGQVGGLLQRTCGLCAFVLPVGIARDDDIAPVG